MASQASKLDIAINLVVPTAPLIIQCDESQIQQILINAVKNSIESIGQSGEITLIARQESPHLSVNDNGPGISDEEQGHLFTPFYSTKPDGQGIGLILIRDVLLNHEATFQLYTDKEVAETRLEISF